MTRRHKLRSNWTDPLPDDPWRNEPRLSLYCLDRPGKPRPLGTNLAFLVDEIYVLATPGGGQYLFIVVHRGRILRRGIWDIEGPPIRRPGQTT